MFKNIHLYIIIGILGSITPVFDKLNLKNLEWSDYLFIRETFFLIFMAFWVYYNKKSFSHLTKLNKKEKAF